MTSGKDLTLKLFQNDYTPVDGSDTSNFTEADFAGYSAKTLVASSWGAATTVSGSAVMTYGTQTWTPTASQTIYGYYVVDSSDDVQWAEKFDSEKALSNGDTFNVVPKFSLTSDEA